MATEFAFLIPVILLITFGIIEFGFALFQWNAAEKATQRGVRLAVVSDPVAPGLTAFDGQSGGAAAGDPCMNELTGAINAFCIYDPNPVVCTSGSCSGYGYSANEFNRLVAEMRRVSPWVQPQNVVVEYRATGLGFVGRPGANDGEFNLVPEVTVRLQNMAYEFFALSAFWDGFDEIAMPQFTASLIGEDLSNLSPP